jgi:hypothetical protein
VPSGNRTWFFAAIAQMREILDEFPYCRPVAGDHVRKLLPADYLYVLIDK